MGADFIALTPTSDTHVSYGHEYEIKTRLLGLINPELSQTWDAIDYASNFSIEEANRKAQWVCDTLEAMVKEAGAKEDEKTLILKGVYYFVNHSDCDGVFYTHECQAIAKALEALDKDEEGDDIAIGKLIKVFNDAYEGDGEVQIW